MDAVMQIQNILDNMIDDSSEQLSFTNTHDILSNATTGNRSTSCASSH